MAKTKPASSSDRPMAAAPIALDREALARAAEVLRARDPFACPIGFGPARKLPTDGWVISCPDGAVAAAMRVLIEAGPALVDALTRAESAGS